MATPHPDGYIAVLPPAEIAKLETKIAAMKLSDASAQKFAAKFFAKTQSFSFDKAGRIGLSEDLLKHAKLGKDAVLVGSLTKFNIYTPERWAQEDASGEGESFGDLMRKFDI